MVLASDLNQVRPDELELFTHSERASNLLLTRGLSDSMFREAMSGMVAAGVESGFTLQW